MDFSPAGNGRLVVSMAVLAGLGTAVWFTMEPGKYRSLTLVLLGFFGFRVLLTFFQARNRQS